MEIGGLSGALHAGQAGIQRGEQKATQAAQDVVEATTDRPVSETSDVADALVEQKEAEQQVEASAEVVKAADETLGTLVDIKA